MSEHPEGLRCVFIATSRPEHPRTVGVAVAAHIGRVHAEHVLVGEAGESGWQLGPWVLERAVRGARTGVGGLHEGFRFHDLRHLYASPLIASGANVKVVQARLRYASASSTLDTYSHVWPDSDESTRTAVEAVLVARADSLRTQEVIV